LEPSEIFTFGAFLQTARLFGGQLGSAFVQTFLRVRDPSPAAPSATRKLRRARLPFSRARCRTKPMCWRTLTASWCSALRSSVRSC
jgi:hypothetical protein